MIRPVSADGRVDRGGAFTPIDRPRVVERIESAAMQRIVLIVAPAGYGKSVALRQYLSELSEPHVRYDIRTEHANLLGFVRGFADAMLDVAPDARKSVSGAFERSSSSKSPGADLALWMHAHVKSFTGTIAIDDLHLAENDPEISRFLVSLIEKTKGRARWVIASRSSLDLPVGSWLAYGDMDLNVDEQDLRFTVDEARSAAKNARVAVRDEELSHILEMTEGWPTAMSFALRSSTRSVDLRKIAANTREMVYRYLAEQVYDSLSLEERQILHFVAYLPEINLDVVKSAGYPKAKAIIEAMRDRVAFIYPDRPNVYRCHDLFREFLQHQLELEGDAAVLSVRQRVGRALEENGDTAGALHTYVQMRSDSDVLRILAESGFALLDQAHSDIVSVAIESLSQELRAKKPIVLALRAVRESEAGHFDRAESLLERAIGSSEDAELRAELRTRLGMLRFNQRRPVIDLLEPVFIDATLSKSVRAKAASLLAPSYAFEGREEQAIHAMDVAESLADESDSDEIRARVHHRMGIAALSLRFPIEEVIAKFRRACTLANDSGLFVTSAAAYAGLHNTTLFYEDDASKCMWYAQQSFAAAMKAGDRYSVQNALLHLLDLETRRGNEERVLELDQRFIEYTTSDSARIAYVLSSRSMLRAWKGEFAEAFRLLSIVPDGVSHFADKIWRDALQALYAFAIDRKDAAIDLSAAVQQGLLTANCSYPYERRIVEMSRLLCAAVEGFLGRLTVSHRIMNQAVDVDAPAVQAMQQVAISICRMVKNPALGGDVVERIDVLKALGWGGIAQILERVLEVANSRLEVEQGPLTKAELGVLERLADGQSPKDIALETGRSVYTIQAHIQNVIKKMGCSGRAEALTVARRKGLLKFN